MCKRPNQFRAKSRAYGSPQLFSEPGGCPASRPCEAPTPSRSLLPAQAAPGVLKRQYVTV